MFFERTSVGLDVHARSVAAHAVDWSTGEVFRGRLVPDSDQVLAWVRALPGPVAVAYEAGPTGFGLAIDRGVGNPLCGSGALEDGASTRGSGQDRCT